MHDKDPGPGEGCCVKIRRGGDDAGIISIAGLIIARWLAADTAALCRTYADLASHFRCEAMGLLPALPRIWHL
jgi:hypothetical protein